MKCQNCGAFIADDPLHDLQDGLVDEFVSHVINPEDSVAVSERWYYCDPTCFLESVEVQP